MPNYTIGSEWRKWDLHFHTPSSFDYKDKGISNQDIIDKLLEMNISVVAITDHHTIDISRIKELQAIGNIHGIVVLPGIELRSDLGGSEVVHYIGIFPENSNIEEIWTDIQSKCKLKPSDLRDKGDDGIYVNLKEAAFVIHENGGLVTIHAGKKTNSIENIRNNHVYKMQIKVDLLKDCIDILEIGNPDVDIEGYNNLVFPSIGIVKPLIICTDNHNINDYKVKRNCWIKSDPTFEGLKQIIYEPQDRVRIQEFKPTPPLRKINSVKIKFETDTKISLNGGEDEDFCFSGLDIDLPLSPYFNCLIGGRGTGKSTFLNLLYKSFDPSRSIEIVDNNTISKDGNAIDLQSCIEIDGTVESIDFLEQNQIEKFATNSVEFTNAIYKRLKNKEKSLSEHEDDLENSILVVDDQINRIEELWKMKEDKNVLIKKLKNYQRISETVESESYLELLVEGRENNKNYSRLKKERENLEILNVDVNTLLDKFLLVDLGDEPSSYSENSNKFLDTLKLLQIQHLSRSKYRLEREYEELLEAYVMDFQYELGAYLKNRGLSEEDLQDVKESSMKIDELKKELEEISKNETKLKNLIDLFSYEKINEEKKLFEDKIIETINELKAILDEVNESNPDEIDKIDLKFNIDENRIKKNLFIDFRTYFELYENGKSGLRWNNIEEYLYKIQPLNIANNDKSFEDLQSAVSGVNLYNKYLSEIFEQEHNYHIYKLLIQKHYLNSVKYLMIDVTYKDKSMNKASFGQKCTAVIVVLLLFGNNPIIIDEPEAHLDSQLIAKYLVYLIKKKKIKRQLIFATHNANFVINGDAEQIYILDMPDKQTQFTQTTIENKTYRDKLLKLEGGYEAFKLRERKYEIK